MNIPSAAHYATQPGATRTLAFYSQQLKHGRRHLATILLCLIAFLLLQTVIYLLPPSYAPNLIPPAPAAKPLPEGLVSQLKITNPTQQRLATQQPAQAGDILAIELTITNPTSEPKSVRAEYHYHDLADYAHIQATAPAAQHNAHAYSLAWPRTVIPAHSQQHYYITARMLSNIPRQASHPARPGSFDCHITVWLYGQTAIPTQCSPLKVLERFTRSLPQANLLLGIIITTITAGLALFNWLYLGHEQREVRRVRAAINHGALRSGASEATILRHLQANMPAWRYWLGRRLNTRWLRRSIHTLIAYPLRPRPLVYATVIASGGLLTIATMAYLVGYPLAGSEPLWLLGLGLVCGWLIELTHTP